MPDYLLRRFQAGKFRKFAVAGNVLSGSGILGKGPAGEIVHQGGNCLVHPAALFRFQKLQAVFLLFIGDDKGMDNADAQHVGDGVEREIGEPQLHGKKNRHDHPEKRQGAAAASSGGMILGYGLINGIAGNQKQENYLHPQHHMPKQ